MVVILILLLLAHILGVSWPVEPLISRVLAIVFIVIAILILIGDFGLIPGVRGPLLR